jgi:polypeptide N-acetylgalactosaminyltransferase
LFFRRVIETWFDDEYKEFFYTREPFARFVDMGNITEQLAMKKRMNCKSFDWFMKEVAYDVFDKYPKLPPNKYWGELRNEASNMCLDTHGRHPPEKVRSYRWNCSIKYTVQTFFLLLPKLEF